MGLFVIDDINIPSEVTSGDAFEVIVNFHYYVEQDTDRDCILMFDAQAPLDIMPPGRTAAYHDGGISLDAYLDMPDPPGMVAAYNQLFIAGQIDSIVNRIFTDDEDVEIWMWLRCRYKTSNLWHLLDSYPVKIPLRVGVSRTIPNTRVWQLPPSPIKKGQLFDMVVNATMIKPVSLTEHALSYVHAEYGGQRKVLWELDHGPMFPGAPIFVPENVGDITIYGVNLEDIVGPITEPRYYNVNIICGRNIQGVIWEGIQPYPNPYPASFFRQDEATTTWQLYATPSPPEPDFLPPPQSIYPPVSVWVSQYFQVVMAFKNYGSPGDLYLNLGGEEVWRGWVGNMEVRSWDSGMVTVPELLGIDITKTEEIAINFELGYIDDQENKVPTRYFPSSVLVKVPAPPAPPEPGEETNLLPVLAIAGGIGMVAAGVLIRR